MVGRRPALHGVAHQLFRPRDDFFRAADDLQGTAPRAGSQRRAAVGVLLVLRVAADSDGGARRSREPAMAVCRGVYAVVDLAGADWICEQPRHADRVPDDAWRRGSHLSARRLEGRQPAVPARRAGIAVRPVRCGHADRTGGRRRARAVDADSLWLARELFHRGFCRTRVADSVVPDHAEATARERRSSRATGALRILARRSGRW